MKQFFWALATFCFIFGSTAMAETKEDSKEAPFAGIGVAVEVKGFTDESPAETIRASNEHPLVIKKLIEGSPSVQAGLKVGDRITKVDDVSVNGLSLQDIVQKIRGKEHTLVNITVERADEQGNPTTSSVAVMRTRQN